MQSFPDHPIIRNCEATGWPDGREPSSPVCPVCGYPCEDIYYNEHTGRIIGCDECVSTGDAWNEPECFPERSEDHE